MENIEEYFEEVPDKNGNLVGYAFNLEGLAKDRAKDLFPDDDNLQKVFVMAYIEGHDLGSIITKKNYDKPVQSKLAPEKPKLFLPNQR